MPPQAEPKQAHPRRSSSTGSASSRRQRPSRRKSARSNEVFDQLRTSYEVGPRWSGSRNEWVKRLQPYQKGRIGEEFFDLLCKEAKLTVTGGHTSGHDTHIEGAPIEVKFGTLHDNDPAADDIVEWLQIRPSGDFTHAALICVCPDHIHLWYVPRDTLLSHAVGQHTGKDATETMKLSIDPHTAPEWLGADLGSSPSALNKALKPATNPATNPRKAPQAR
jgi:hypothetical protein